MTIVITKPSSGVTLSGVVPVEATFNGKNFEIATVTVDGKQLASDSAQPISFSIDTARVPDGAHTLTVAVRYRTASGAHRWQKASIPTATEGNDMQANLSTSGGSANLAGTVTVTVSIQPPQQAELPVSCKFLVDGVQKALDTSYPLTFAWDTTTVADGNHVLKAVVTAGPRTRSAQGAMTVSVFNNVLPPPPPPSPPQAVPVIITPQAISPLDPVKEGQTLTVSNGVWTNSPTSYTRHWDRCDAAGANCVDIPSATGITYTLAAADVGKTIRCWTSAFNSVGASIPLLSAQTAVVSALAPVVPVLVAGSEPIISGTPTEGNILGISNGAWTNSPTSYLRRWTRCDTTGENCVDITGATLATYLLVAADVGKAIRCWTTAQNASGNSIATRSAATALVAPPTPPPLPPGPAVITTNLTNNQQVTCPYTWTASVTPAPTSVEFWADGTLLATDTSSPFSHSLTLAPGSHQMGLCAWVAGVRTCLNTVSTGVHANINVVGTPTPPPTGSHMLVGSQVTLDPGEIAAWNIFDSATTQFNGAQGDKHRIICWDTAGGMPSAFYSGRITYSLHGFRLVSGSAGRMFDWHTQPSDAPWGWQPPGSNRVAPLAIDYPAQTASQSGLVIVAQAEQDAGQPWTYTIATQAEMEARRGQWVWLWTKIVWGRRGAATQGALTVWMAGEDSPRVNVSGINTHWAEEHQVTFWEGAYWSNGAPVRSINQLAATRFGRTPRECFEDTPVVFTRYGAGTPPGEAIGIASVEGNVSVPLSLRWSS